ncbi:MAG: hypothetical protein ACOC9Y_04910, partial [Chloroflexota bacterium]
AEPSRLRLEFLTERPVSVHDASTSALYRRLLDLHGDDGALRGDVVLAVGLDVDPEHEDDFNAWYDTEHLPNLAKVDGVYRAHRYRREGDQGRDADGFPRYLALYDLASPEVFGSDGWREAVETPWTNRLRPHFKARIRSVYRPVDPAAS